MTIDLEALAQFLAKAKKATYAGDGIRVRPQRPLHKELAFSEGDWDYRDSYTGYFGAPGQELVRFQDEPIWSMAYDGGMLPEFQEDLALAESTFAFLKKTLQLVIPERPFRGPQFFAATQEEDPNIIWQYSSEEQGDITRFLGKETITQSISGHPFKKVFSQNYMGGLIIHK